MNFNIYIIEKITFNYIIIVIEQTISNFLKPVKTFLTSILIEYIM